MALRTFPATARNVMIIERKLIYLLLGLLQHLGASLVHVLLLMLELGQHEKTSRHLLSQIAYPSWEHKMWHTVHIDLIVRLYRKKIAFREHPVNDVLSRLHIGHDAYRLDSGEPPFVDVQCLAEAYHVLYASCIVFLIGLWIYLFWHIAPPLKPIPTLEFLPLKIR